MAVYKPRYRDKDGRMVESKVYWYEFVFSGERIRESTKQGNKRTAEQMEAARKTQLAKGEVGIQERKPIPTLKDFAPRFEQAIELHCAEKPRAVTFYKAKLQTLLADEALSTLRLDAIDEAAIEAYKQRRGKVTSRRKLALSPGAINRELATLRRLLRLAHEWKVTQRVPRVHLLRGEKHREFVLTHQQEQLYLSTAPSELSDIAVVLLDTGLRIGEPLKLAWAQVRLDPVQGSRFGFITVLSGNAKNSKARNVPLSERAVAVLHSWRQFVQTGRFSDARTASVYPQRCLISSIPAFARC